MTRDADAKTTWRLLPWLGFSVNFINCYTAQYPKQYIASWAQTSCFKRKYLVFTHLFAIGFAWVGMRRLLKYVGMF